MRSEGYGSRSVSVCLSTTILALQATRPLMSDTNSFSGTWAKKNKMVILLTAFESDKLADSVA